MKKYLLTAFVTLFLLVEFLVPHSIAFAQLGIGTVPTPTTNPSVPVPTDEPGKWQSDPDVTFVGKVGARAGDFLDWSLREYTWVKKAANQDGAITLGEFWKTIAGFAYLFMVIIILITAFVMIITRGRSITFVRFLPRFAIVLLLITFSFALVQFLYQTTDAVQGFFLKNPECNPVCPSGSPPTISQQNLLYVGFKYKEFEGFRLTGAANDESYFISLLLIKLTAATYYVMTGILILRKVILWFFIIISPILPLLMLYAPIRNTAKIWVGEFFRWLLYAPIFSIFLGGLVKLWRASIPLDFTPPASHAQIGTQIYPTAINILLGGPGQRLDINNSVNLPETFALYVVALLMLWVAVLLPFLLLQIFLDYLATVSIADNATLKQIINSVAVLGRGGAPVGPGPSGPPGSYQPAGMAKQLPFANVAAKLSLPKTQPAGEAREIPRSGGIPTLRQMNRQSEFLRLTNLPLPTMRDIARFETATLSKDISRHEEVAQIHEALERIANPAVMSTPADRAQYTDLRGRIIAESQQGNAVATSILSAASTVAPLSVSQPAIQSRTNEVLSNISNPSLVQNPVQRTRFVNLRQKLIQESKSGNTLASQVLSFAQTSSSQNSTKTVLTNIANPVQITNAVEKQHYTDLSRQLVEARQHGSPIATSILSAVTLVSQSKEVDIKTLHQQLVEAKEKGDGMAVPLLAVIDKQSATSSDTTDLKEKLKAAKEKGDTLASSVLLLLSEAEKTTPAAPSVLPSVNRVQEVSLDDYEAVKKMWIENYQKLDVPQNVASSQKDRTSWITEDIDKISHTINMLVSSDPQRVTQGMKSVSSILPFLLIGGFSQAEVAAYLKAKLEAAKTVLSQLQAKEEEESTMLEAKKKKEETQKEMAAEEKVAKNNNPESTQMKNPTNT